MGVQLKCLYTRMDRWDLYLRMVSTQRSPLVTNRLHFAHFARPLRANVNVCVGETAFMMVLPSVPRFVGFSKYK